MGTKHLRAAQKLATDTLVELYTLDISRYGGPVLRWTPGPLAGVSQNRITNPCFRTTTAGWTKSFGVTWGPAASYGAAYSQQDVGSGFMAVAGSPSWPAHISSADIPITSSDAWAPAVVDTSGQWVDLVAPHAVGAPATAARAQASAHATGDTLPAQADLIAPLSILGTVTMTRAQTASSSTGDVPTQPAGITSQDVQWWEAQARVVPIRSTARIDLTFLDADNTELAVHSSPTLENGSVASARRLDDYTILHIRAQAPTNAVKCRMSIVMQRQVGGTDPAIIFTMAQIARVQGKGSGGPFPWSEPRADGSPRNVVFGGVSYTPFPLLIEGISWTTRGAMPRPRVTVPDVDSYFTQLLVGYESLLACSVSRVRVFAANLDGGPDPDSTSFFGPETWYVDRIARHRAGEEVVIELANPLDLQGKMLPGRQVIRDSCTHVYRKHNGTTFTMGTCPYAGANFFKADGTTTIFPGEDSCGKRLKDCKLRFPNSALPTRAFPGVGKYRT